MFEPGAGSVFDGQSEEPPIRAIDVLRDWRRILGRERPWMEMAPDDIDGYMRRILVALIDEDRSTSHCTRLWRLRTMGREHGVFRRSQQCAVDCIECELDVLRYAIEKCLGRSRTSANTKRGIVAVLNAEFVVIQSAVALGWYNQPMPPP